MRIKRTKIVLYPAFSLDGFIAKDDGDSNWVTEEDEQLFVHEAQEAGCVIVGNRTFKQFENIIYPIPQTTTFVCTSHRNAVQEPVRTGVRYVGGEIQAIIREIESAGFDSAILSGGADTNGRFAQAQAIDEIFASVYPLLLGKGLPLFGNWQVHLNLELLNSRQLGKCVVHNRYAVLRD